MITLVGGSNIFSFVVRVFEFVARSEGLTRAILGARGCAPPAASKSAILPICRTPDQLVRSQLLYPAELRAHMELHYRLDHILNQDVALCFTVNSRHPHL